MFEGESDLSILLRQMEPRLNPGEYVFCSVAMGSLPPEVDVLASFIEDEGLSVILRREQAEAVSIPFTFPSAWITLTVHSALDAVGLTAAVSTALARAGISCNVVAAAYHDHLFVPFDDGERALAVLKAI